MKTDETKDQGTPLSFENESVRERTDDFDFSYIPSFDADAPIVLFDEPTQTLEDTPEDESRDGIDNDGTEAQTKDEIGVEPEIKSYIDAEVEAADDAEAEAEDDAEAEAEDVAEAEVAEQLTELPDEPTITNEDIREAENALMQEENDTDDSQLPKEAADGTATVPDEPTLTENDIREAQEPSAENDVTHDTSAEEVTDTEDSQSSADAHEPSLAVEDVTADVDGEDDTQISFFDAEENDTKESDEQQPQEERPINARFDFLELCIFTLVTVLIITTFFFRHSIVDGASMEQTLYNGDRLILSSFLYTPEAGDIIVCEDYSTPLRKPIVKRVIATAGQTVEIYDGRTVYVDGELIDDSYVYIDKYDDTIYQKHTVAEGHIFVMGDHRNASTDSRAIGDVSIDSVIGKVVMRIYPFDAITFFP